MTYLLRDSVQSPNLNPVCSDLCVTKLEPTSLYWLISLATVVNKFICDAVISVVFFFFFPLSLRYDLKRVNP